MLRRRGPCPSRRPGRSTSTIVITGGDAVTHEDGVYRVPKRDLVSTCQVLLQGERLKIASALPEAATLTQELLNPRHLRRMAGRGARRPGTRHRAGGVVGRARHGVHPAA